MNILLSTNLFNKASEWEQLPEFLLEEIGVEVFPLWQDKDFEKVLESFMPILKNRVITFHSPYYGVEPSLSKRDIGYDKMMEEQKKTIQWAQKLGGKNIVFHHNNTKVTDQAVMKKESHDNYLSIGNISNSYGIVQLVENAGVKDKDNVLFDEKEFIEYCKENNKPCLIDVGHVNCNGWDIEKIIIELKNQIKGYHLHNNDGKKDSHKRILDGTFDMVNFAKLYKKHTPNVDLILEYSHAISLTPNEFKEDVNWLRENFSN